MVDLVLGISIDLAVLEFKFVFGKIKTMSDIYNAMTNLYILGALLVIALALVLLVAKKYNK